MPGRPEENGLQIYQSNLLYLPTDVDDPDGILPTEFALAQNYLNPFNPSTTIEFSLPRTTEVSLVIFNLLGQNVATLADRAPFGSGTHSLQWDGRDNSGQATASGVYFYRLTAERLRRTEEDDAVEVTRHASGPWGSLCRM